MKKNGMKKFTIPIIIIYGIKMKERGFVFVGRAFCTGLGALGGTKCFNFNWFTYVVSL